MSDEKEQTMERLTFESCVNGCLANPQFVSEFDRLFGTSLSRVPARSPIEIAVDQATGFEPLSQDLKKFVAFVYETVWKRLDPALLAPQSVQPPPGMSFAELIGQP